MITAVVLTKNEEGNIGRCLRSLQFCDRVLVVDNASTDRTQDIAKQHTASVLTFSSPDDFSALRNFALSKVTSPWTLFVDADEVVSSELAQEILAAIKSTTSSGYLIKRMDWFKGKRLNFGDSGTAWLLRLGKTKSGEWRGKVHEKWQMTGSISRLHHSLHHYPHPTVYEFLSHINSYSSIRAQELYTSGRSAHIFSLFLYPLAKFVQLYIVKLGFLDATPGFVSAMTMSFYSFLVRGKLYLLSKGIPSFHAPAS